MSISDMADRRFKAKNNIKRIGRDMFDWVAANEPAEQGPEFQGIKADTSVNCDVYMWCSETDIMEVHHVMAEALDEMADSGDVIRGEYVARLGDAPEIDLEVSLYFTDEALEEMVIPSQATTDIVSIEHPNK